MSEQHEVERADLANLIEALSRELGFLHTERHYRISYGYDATGIRGCCGGVAFPRDVEELARLVRECSSRGIPLFARGAGSGFSGGSVPQNGGLVLSTERMNKILRFDAETEEVDVESGVVNQELQDFLENLGYFYPPDPASLKFSTIGGNISENAGGPRAYKYGVTRRYVRSVTWVTPRGETISAPLEGPTALLVGAEGTLGIVYATRLSVLPLPRTSSTSILEVVGEERAIGFAFHLLSQGFHPSVIEYIDAGTMGCVGEYKQLDGIRRGAGYLFVEIDGAAGEVDTHRLLLEKLCREEGVRLRTASNTGEREFLWEVRRAVSPSLARRGITKVNEDVSVPLGRLEEAVSFVHGLAADLDLECYIFGHCGDGNLHVNIMTDRRRSEEMLRVGLFVEKLFEAVVRFGGTLSGEHGIGMTKKRYLGYRFSAAEMDLQRCVKMALDGAGIINPGKYFC